MSDEGTLAAINFLGLSYIAGLPASSQIALPENIQEKCPGLFDEQLTEFTESNKRYVPCRHHRKGYRRQAKNQQDLRKAYEGLKKIKGSPQNTSKEKLYHRAMKVLEKYNQTKCWELSFETVQDRNGKKRYLLVYKFQRQQFRAVNTIGLYHLLQTGLSHNSAASRYIFVASWQSKLKLLQCLLNLDLNVTITIYRLSYCRIKQ
jgi:hypothetical protein